jgi:hypothetical protein
MLLFVYEFSSGGGANQSKLKQRRMAKRLARERLKPSIVETDVQDQTLKSTTEETVTKVRNWSRNVVEKCRPFNFSLQVFLKAFDLLLAVATVCIHCRVHCFLDS